MIRMEYPKANIEGLTDIEKIYALKRQLDTLTNNVQLVLESIDGDIEGINESIGGTQNDGEEDASTIREDINDLMRDVSTLMSKDYIVEQGTSGVWTYRKWNSGIAECWGKSEQISRTFNNPLGSGYYGAKYTATYPSGLFIDTPVVDASIYDAGAVIGWVAVSTNNPTTVEVYFGSLINVTKNVQAHFNAKGRWK